MEIAMVPSASAMAGLHITLLGAFRVSIGSRPVPDSAWRASQARNLLILLALAPDHRLHRDQIMEWLWPDRKPANAANSLHQASYALRHILEPELPQAASSSYIQMHAGSVVLTAPDRLWIDVDAFTAAAAAARRARTSAMYEAALQLYTGDLLPDDPYADWATTRREELRTLYRALLAEQARLYEQEGQIDRAIRALNRLIEVESTEEAAHMAIMRLHARAGRRTEAVRQYRLLEKALRHELDVGPGPNSRRLYREILEGRFPREDEGTRPATTDGPRVATPAGSGVPDAMDRPGSDLPAHTHGSAASPAEPMVWPDTLARPPTDFIGREQELRDILTLLATSRVLTLTGAGGCGKTRLALQAAALARQAYADGVWLVELDAVTDDTLVAQAVATVLGVAEERTTGKSRAETLVEALRSRHLLLLLDNCEHLLRACAALVEQISLACPQVGVLATSREPLHCAGETVWQVPPMTLPETDVMPAIETLLQYDAVRLFVERSQVRRASFVLTEQNAASVIHICGKLEGIPLAIELAAARITLLSASEIAARLDSSLAVLAHADQGAQTRQRTVHATITWSHDLLSESERILFRRLSVFAGGWTLEAAETVCVGDGIEAQSLLDLLAQLVDKSLVVAREQDGQSRFRLLDPIRHYSAERLNEAGETVRLRERHGAWCATLAETALPELTGANQAVWLDRLEREHDNLRAALRAAVQMQDAEIAMRLGAALWRFWFQRGHLREGRVWLEQALALDREGRYDGTMLRARALSALGALVWPQGDYARAQELFEASLALRRQLDDPQGVAGCLNNLGNVAQYQGDYARAAACHEESLAISRQIEDTWGIAGSLTNLAVVAGEQGDYTQAETYFGESLELRRQLGDMVSIALTLGNLGVLARYRRAYARAETLLAESLELRRRMGDRWGSAGVLANLGSVALDQQQHSRAQSWFAESIALCRELGDQRVAAYCLEGFAALAVAQRQPRRGVRLAAAAAALRQTTNAFLPPNERATIDAAMQAARAALGEEIFAAVWAAGQALPVDQAITHALTTAAPGEAEPVPSHSATNNHGVASLTSREREVVRLIAAGRTNRQIAEALHIAEPTAAKHVGNILAKLGLDTREQVAAWYAANRHFLT
jgi:predicted ATPase/DNA-binding SARP family transcriptional activator/DNA-binding CsgD family transcriptional regulator